MLRNTCGTGLLALTLAGCITEVGTHLVPASTSDTSGSDERAPHADEVLINGGDPYAQHLELSLSFSATDDRGIVAYLVSEHDTTDPHLVQPPVVDPAPRDARWVSLEPTRMLDMTVPWTPQRTALKDGSVDLCVWLMDASDNVSVRACDQIRLGPISGMVFEETWEGGRGAWSTTGSVWEVGEATSGPGACLNGIRCAATVLDGNYPDAEADRLISPDIVLPTLPAGTAMHLGVWHWFDYGHRDVGQIEIALQTGPSTWGPWQPVGPLVQGGESGGWSFKSEDISAHAGHVVRLGLRHTEDGANVGPGWYVDRLRIMTFEPTFTGDFEAGWAHWAADNGVWQIGTPSAEPAACGEGTHCAATVLDGDYPNAVASRLVSASVSLPIPSSKGQVRLRFQEWFDYGSSDSGNVQVSTFDGATGDWQPWQDVGTPSAGASTGWTTRAVDLTPFAGQLVRIGFHHVELSSGRAAGWAIDDIAIEAD